MKFMLGCNYWASDLGTEMWANWNEVSVDYDLKMLSEHGLKYLRVFPLWRDFQPVCALYAIGNTKFEYRHKDGQFFDNPYYLDDTMMDRFAQFCEIANKYGLKLIVGLLTGWMCGRTFTPPLLEGRDLYTDPTALLMEQKFVRGFVSRFCKNGAICAWDLGNECNCMSSTGSKEVSANWTAIIASTIRAYDSTNKPVVSGMHSLTLDRAWSVFDQGEYMDILTTHPYPYFVPHCDVDDMTSFRTLVHASCEGVYYSDMGGKPCLTEEIGTLGPMTCDDETSAAFLKTNLFSNWINGSLGVFWWCGCEETNVEAPPYSWCMLEREQGLLDVAGQPKQVLLAYQSFSKWLETFGKELPAAKKDAVCILSRDQDHWGVAYMSYALAKQAHINLQFNYSEMRNLPEAEVYMLPSLTGMNVMCKETMDQLVQRVYDGATLYISNDNSFMAHFEKLTGMHVVNSMKPSESGSVTWNGEEIPFNRRKRSYLESVGAEVLAYDNLGIPALTKHAYGQGIVYYVNFPLESMLLGESMAFHTNRYKIYDGIFAEVKKQQPVSVENPFVGMTCHYESTGDLCYVALVNYSNEAQAVGMGINSGYELVEAHVTGTSGCCEVTAEPVQTLPAHEAAILTLKRLF